MHISSKHNNYNTPKKSKRVITGAFEVNEDDLRLRLEELLTSDDCLNVVMYAIGEDGTFAEDEFMDSSTFWDIYDNETAEEMVEAFYAGEDLDDNEDHANPDRDYFRRDGTYGSVESTDYPGDVYMERMLDDIIDYIIENIDYADSMDLDEDVMEAIESYLGTSEEDGWDSDDGEEDDIDEEDNEDEE